jgi:hypothetical protein
VISFQFRYFIRVSIIFLFLTPKGVTGKLGLCEFERVTEVVKKAIQRIRVSVEVGKCELISIKGMKAHDTCLCERFFIECLFPYFLMLTHVCVCVFFF